MLQDRIRALTRETLRGMRRGIEKESLRARPDGSLALTRHPAALGSALAHPHITTDFSESQLELITAAHALSTSGHAPLPTPARIAAPYAAPSVVFTVTSSASRTSRNGASR